MNTTDRLLRRVQRHATIATLLRNEVTDTSGGGSADRFPFVMPGDSPASNNNPVATLWAAGAHAPDPTPTIRPAPSSSRVLPEFPDVPIPSAISEPAVGPDQDKTWRRLQTIFNRHKHKAATTSEVQEPTDAQSTVAASDDQALQGREDNSSPHPVQHEAIPSSKGEIPRVHNAPGEAPLTPATATPDTAKDILSNTVATFPGQESTSTVQPLPLDKVWPVQKAHTTSSANLEPQLPSARRPTTLTTWSLVEVDQSEAIQAVLENVLPQSPSDSSVELIPPRYPRPAHASSPERIAERLLPSGAAMGDMPITVPEATTSTVALSALRQATSEPITTGIGPLPRDLWALLGQAPPAALIPQLPEMQASEMRTPLSLDAVAPLGAKWVNPVENTRPRDAITPVAVDQPASIWEESAPWAALVGDTPLDKSTVPESLAVARQDLAAETFHSAVVSTRNIDVESPTLSSTPWLTGEVPPQPSGQDILMSAELPVNETAQVADEQTSAIIGPPEIESGEGQKTDKIDIDELARRVYLDIKRRLAREWERTRGQD